MKRMTGLEKAFAPDILREGGEWLGAVRNWVLWNRGRAGAEIIWGSDQEIQRPITMRELEQIASEAVAADRHALANRGAERKS